MSLLFSPLQLRRTTLRNRIVIPPMCQYSAQEGLANDWHLVHLGGLARGGAGLILAEATAVVPEGRITAQDLGLWNDEQAQALSRVTAFMRSQGAAAGIQLAHAGRKASLGGSTGRSVPVRAGGWQTVGPSAIGYPGLADPRALSVAEIADVVGAFAAAAGRALTAGFDAVEIHAAHGYLIHEFLSPLSNDRTDAYGGPLANRARLLLEVVDAVRNVWPEDRPLLVRVSATDWTPGGLTVDDSVVVAGWMRDRGVDLVDVSAGGNAANPQVKPGPGFMVPLSAQIRREARIPTCAVGLITSAEQAEAVLADGDADLVAIGRAALRDPQWPLRAAHELGVALDWPPQLTRGSW